jgi:hypothetical protein
MPTTQKPDAVPAVALGVGGGSCSSVKKLQLVPRYNQQVIDHLEELLQRAKDGAIHEVVITVKTSAGMYDHSWTGCDNLFELVGFLERQKLAMLRRMDA